MHNFKKIIKTIVVVAVCVTLLAGLDMALYPCTFMRNDIHAVVSNQYDDIILGTSHGMTDIDPAVMEEITGRSGHNVCVGGGYELSKVEETFTQKWNKDYDIAHLKSDTQEYHESGLIERYPVDTTKLKMKDLKLFEEEQVNPQNMEYLGRLIDFCRENDIQFVAVTTPIPINTLQAYSDNYNAAWKYFGQYFDEHEVTYLNFNTQYFKAFSHDLSDYTDFDGHMNGNAAKEYSKVLANILKGEGV